MTRKQVEERAKVEDALKWGMFEGEEPTADQVREAEQVEPARSAEQDKNLRELGERVAAQLDEQTGM